MRKFNVYVLYTETVEAEDQFEAERKALQEIEKYISCEEIFEDEISDEQLL